MSDNNECGITVTDARGCRTTPLPQPGDPAYLLVAQPERALWVSLDRTLKDGVFHIDIAASSTARILFSEPAIEFSYGETLGRIEPNDGIQVSHSFEIRNEENLTQMSPGTYSLSEQLGSHRIYYDFFENGTVHCIPVAGNPSILVQEGNTTLTIAAEHDAVLRVSQFREEELCNTDIEPEPETDFKLDLELEPVRLDFPMKFVRKVSADGFSEPVVGPWDTLGDCAICLDDYGKDH